MYDYFIEWIARPVYRFIIKPTIAIWEFIKTCFRYTGKFLWYLMFATTGNIIVISCILKVFLKYGLPSFDHSKVNSVIAILGPFIAIGIFVICCIFIYNIFNWAFSSDRKDIISKEPRFIRSIESKIRIAFYDMQTDVIKSDDEIQDTKRRKKEKKEAKKLLAMAEKRIKKEAEVKKEEERKRKLDIIHNRAEILDL